MADDLDTFAAIARLFEDAAPFDGIDLDEIDGAADASVEPVEDVAPEPRARDATGRKPAFDSGLWPYVYWKRLRACAALDQCDTDNARRLLRHRGSDVLVRSQEGGRAPIFVVWTGDHWDDVTGGYRAKALAQTIGEEIKREAHFLRASVAEAVVIEAGVAAAAKPDDEQTEPDKAAIKRMGEAVGAVAKRKAERAKFGVSCKNDGRLNAMLANAAPHVLISPDAFNADPLRVATPTQTLIWSRRPDPECPDPDALRHLVQLRVRPGHSRRDLITVMLPHSFDPKADCPRWRAFMARFQPDPATARFVQIAMGLGLLGVTTQVLIFHYGEGANGKSVALEVISRVLGPLAAGLPAEAIAGDDQGGGVKPSPEIARLYGKRFVRIAEVEKDRPLQEAFVKRITGSEAFPARNLFEGYFEFIPRFVPHMSGNGYPRVSGTDNGIWRRMRVVKWPVVLEEAEQRDFGDVVGEMMEEAPGILAWLVEGATLYLQEGLISPPSVIAETQSYRDEMDSVGRFVRSCVHITTDPATFVTGREMYQAYGAWAMASGLKPVSETRFGRDMKAVKGVIKDEGRIRLYRCVLLHDVPRNPTDGFDGEPDPRGW